MKFLGLEFQWRRMTLLENRAPYGGVWYTPFGERPNAVDPALQLKGFSLGFWLRPAGVFSLAQLSPI